MDQGKHKHGRGKILHVERDFDTIEKRNRGTYLKNMKHLYIEMQNQREELALKAQVSNSPLPGMLWTMLPGWILLKC